MTTLVPLLHWGSTRNNEHGLLWILLALEVCNIQSRRKGRQRFLRSFQSPQFFAAH